MRRIFRQMRWRIAGAYIVLLALALALLAGVALALLRATYTRTLESGIAGQARLVAAVAGSRMNSPSAELDGLVHELNQQIGARVTLIDAQGTVLADSFQPAAASPNLRQRPEVRDALELGQGESERYSVATGDNMFFVAVPVGAPAARRGVARVGVLLTTIAQAQAGFGAALLATALLAAALAVALALMIARRITRPLHELKLMARQLASGDMSAQAPIPSDEALAELAQDFNRMASRLRHVEQARRSFLANISHDLRTPLASLQAMIDTLQQGALDDRPAAEDFLTRMDAEVQGLNHLVNEFLELSRIESGELALQIVTADLQALLQSVCRRMAAQAQQRGVALELVVPAALPMLAIDADRLAQALLNLLQNALSFTPSGGTIILTAASDGDCVDISVRDTGIGIAPEHVPHIFERFYKADQSRASAGTGLGLAIAKHLVERHGGHIGAESRPGQGTVVTISLPIRSRLLGAEHAD